MRNTISLAPNRKMEGSEEATVIGCFAGAPEQESETGESVTFDAKKLLNKSFCEEEEEAPGELGGAAECGSGEVQEKDDSKVSIFLPCPSLMLPPSLTFHPSFVFLHSSPSLPLPLPPSHGHFLSHSPFLSHRKSPNQPPLTPSTWMMAKPIISHTPLPPSHAD